MMVGSTGAGKTTLVDGMLNYVTDVSFEDDFRFTMVDLTSEEKGKESNQVLVVSAFLYVYFTSQSKLVSFIYFSNDDDQANTSFKVVAKNSRPSTLVNE